MLRRAAASFVLATLLTSFGYSQGLVYFFNTSSTLILTNGSGPVQSPGNYYFGLFIAEPGATDPSQFVFTGIYATNLSAAGRINGGSAVVPNWLPGQIKSYQVRGWSANLGHDWEKVKDALTAYFPFGFYGSSAIAQGTAGGFDGTNTLPTLFMFGAAGGLGGFSLNQFGMEPMSARLLSRPPDQTVRQWQDVSMGVSVTGLPPIYYTWYFNGQVIAGATVNPLVIPRVQLTNAGTYSVAVTNPYGGMKSADATLTVIPSDEPPYIVAQPQSQSVDAGSNVTLRVQAGGALPLFYQWRFENAELTGENSKELTLVNIQMSHAGSYAVVITNTGGAITSAVANVIVRPPPGHGLVQFLNSVGTLTVTNASTVGGTSGPTAPIPNLYYFGLFLGPPGMTNQAEFTFSGAYATNQAFAGRFTGGTAELTNWFPGTSRSVLIRGWSSTLGHDWSAVKSQWNEGTNSQWLGTGFFGTSEIGSGIAGGWDGTNAYPSFVTYGAASGLTNPLVLNLVPPPHYATLSSASPTVEGFRLRIAVSGFRGSARIWSSTNAVDWSPLGSVDITSDAVEYLDTSTVAEQRFYRVQQ